MSEIDSKLIESINEFRRARQRAAVLDFLRKVSGSRSNLLSFDEVRQNIKAQGSLYRGIQNIPLNHIVGSVNRYDDFTRDFLPRRSINPQRWARVNSANYASTGLPPIDVYQIGNTYYVIDGNHRVSVARASNFPSIQAYVYQVPSRIQVDPEDNLETIVLKAEKTEFLDQTQLDVLHPEIDWSVSVPAHYRLLLEHIEVHRNFMGLDLKRDISSVEAVEDWFQNVFLPLITIIRDQELRQDFPNLSETDLYALIAKYRQELEISIDSDVNPQVIADDLVRKRSRRVDRFALRFVQRIVDLLIPDTLKSGPAAGEWRRLKFGKSLEHLFSEILVPVSGEDSGWNALEQAIRVAQREDSRLRGMHVAAKNQKTAPQALAIQDEFLRRCQLAEVKGDFHIYEGSIADKIIERSRWNDLVVVNLSYPLSVNQIYKLGSGFRELVLRSPRPILAVPKTVSNLASALLAYDGSPKAEEALYLSAYLARKWQIPLNVLSVFSEAGQAASVQKHAQEVFTEYGVSANFIQRQGPIATEILISAEETCSDLIVMGGYGDAPLVNLLLDNILDQVLRNSHTPMLLCR